MEGAEIFKVSCVLTEEEISLIKNKYFEIGQI